jgi:hypothetical protein
MGFFDENRIVPFPFTGILSMIVLLITVAAFIYFYKTNYLQSASNSSMNFLEKIMELIAPFVGPILWVIIAASVTAAIVLMAKKSACSSSSPTDIARYEGFASPSEIRSLIKQGEKAVDRIQDTLDTIMNAADDTCGMLKDVEEMYVGNQSAPKTDEEANLPENVRNDRIDDRKRRARKRFLEERKLHASLKSETFKKHGIYECFQDVATPGPTAPPEETDLLELREVKHSLKTALENAEVKLATIRIDKLETALAFIQHQYNKSQRAATKEGFATGGNDVQEMQDLLDKEKRFYNASQQLLKYIQEAKKFQQGTYKAANDFENGKMDQDTMKALLPVPKPVQGNCKPGLYQYALYSGGFCCEEPPTDYLAEHKDFSACHRGACSQNPETATKEIPLCS